MYVTAAEVSTYLEKQLSDLPSDINRLIKRAGDQIYSYVKRNYDSTNAEHVLAMKNAVCAQVEFFIEFTETSAISGNGINSFSGGSISVSYNSSTAGSKLSSRAKQYLNDQGLLFKGLINAFNGRLDDEE